MTLNGIIALFCIISRNSIALQADYITVFEARLIMSTKYRPQLHLAKTDPRSSRTVSLRQLSFLFTLLSDKVIRMSNLVISNGDCRVDVGVRFA